MTIPWACNEYIQSPHKDQGTKRPSNCCRNCGKTKEAHEAYERYRKEITIIWNGKRHTFKDVEEMIKNRFFPG